VGVTVEVKLIPPLSFLLKPIFGGCAFNLEKKNDSELNSSIHHFPLMTTISDAHSASA
jgi:hypothetical protein